MPETFVALYICTSERQLVISRPPTSRVILLISWCREAAFLQDQLQFPRLLDCL